jgi:large subunit ribosomal protein L21e
MCFIVVFGPCSCSSSLPPFVCCFPCSLLAGIFSFISCSLSCGDLIYGSTANHIFSSHAAMPHSKGYRSRTRHRFSKGFGEHGPPNISTYLRTYRMGDIVDVKANSAVHKGMPHKFYHGRTGVVFDVNPRALGVIINKQVRQRIIPKRIHVRIEHVQPSMSRAAHIDRVRENDRLRREAKITGVKLFLKRQPEQPREAHTVSMKHQSAVHVSPIPYEALL